MLSSQISSSGSVEPAVTKTGPSKEINKVSGRTVVSSDSGISKAKGACQKTPMVNGWEAFLTAQGKVKSDYVAVDCTNIALKNDHIPLEGNWQGLFPQIFLTGEVILGTSQKFEIDSETEQFEDLTHNRSANVMTFSGLGLKSIISGIREEMDWTQLPQKRVASVSVDEEKIGTRDIYLILPELEQLDSEDEETN